MISLTHLKNHLLEVFRVLSTSHGSYIDIVYKGRLYRVIVEDLDQTIVKRRRPRRVDLSQAVRADKCPRCKRLMINGVCMNSNCMNKKSPGTMARAAAI